MPQKKQVLVTGAAGFIGFHLSQALAQRGDLVIGYDNFNDYYSPQLKRLREKKLLAAGIKVYEGDVCDLSCLENLVEKYKITHLVHLAAQAGVRFSLENPQAYIKSNVEGFTQILELCRHWPQIILTYASSSSVYGFSGQKEFSETDRTDSQASLYGVTKKSNELLAKAYHHLFGIRSTGLRYFTVYGPWGRPDMAYFSFTEAILNNRPIALYNEGNMVRDFTYIDDIISGTMAAIDLGAASEIFNLGNHHPVPIMELIANLEKYLNLKAKIEYLPMQKGDVPSTCANLEKSQAMLGFYPNTLLGTGIDKFVRWYRNDYQKL